MSEPPHSAVLVLGFGGPEGPDDVMPFLENVTRGRDVPRERLEEVAEQYDLFDGVSPINEQNRELVAALQDELDRRGRDLPVVLGNRNWAPFVEDTVADLAASGHERVVAFATAAYSSYSACRQYLEDIERARGVAGAGGTGHRQDQAVLEPPRLRRGNRRPGGRGIGAPGRGRPARRRARLHRALDPDGRGGDLRLRGAAPGRGRPRRGTPGRHRPGPPLAAGLPVPVGPAAGALARTRHQRSPGRDRRRGRHRRGRRPDRLPVGPHGGPVRPRHRRPRPPPTASACTWCGRPRSAPIRRSSPGSPT